MLRSYIKVAIRNLYRNKFFAVVNIIGLGTAMALAVVGYVNYQFSQSFDAFHENADQIHLVSIFQDENGQLTEWSYVPMPLGPTLKDELPSIQRFSRTSLASGCMRYGEKIFGETCHLVDKDFFKMFTFPLLRGEADPLGTPDGVVINNEIARKYFGDEDPLGRYLTFATEGGETVELAVRGIIEKPPLNSCLNLRVVMSYENMNRLYGYDIQSWDLWSRALFVQLAEGASTAELSASLKPYLDQMNAINPEFQQTGFRITPLRQLAPIVRDLHGRPFRAGMHPAAIHGPSVAALMVLLLACFNFINTAVAFSGRRLREIGIRKVIGGVRGQLVRQFLSENLILCLAALLVAVVLAEIFVPAYDSLWPELSLTMNYSENLGLIGFFLLLLVFTAIAAGAYPAFYVSQFRPAQIFRGKQKVAGTSPLIRTLLTLQLAIAMSAIVGAVILSQNAQYMKTMDHGFDKDDVLVLPVSDEQDYARLRDAVQDLPGVEGTAASRNLMGWWLSATNMTYKETQTPVNYFQFGENFFEMAGFELVSGRVFDADLSTDVDETVIVNETLVRQFGWSDPPEETIKLGSGDDEKTYRVIGVVKDFFPSGVNYRIDPTIIRLVPPERYQFLAVRCNPEQRESVSAAVQHAWEQLFPLNAWDGFWLEDELASEERVNNSIRLVMIYNAVIVVIISCMGLYALVGLNITRRTKEMGIRKALGASVAHLGVLISREFLLLIALGSVLAAIMGYFMIDLLLGSIWEYYTSFGVAPFVLAPLLVLTVAALTIGHRILSAARTNPVEALRYE